MKDSNQSSSRPGTSEPAQVTTEVSFKDPMFSSSDTDDCDADKLVIDLDAAVASSAEATAQQQTHSPVDVKLAATSTTTTTTASKSHHLNASDPHGQKSAQTSACSNSNRTACNSAVPTAGAADSVDKGLKMKIVKCTLGATSLHEVSQIHSSSNSTRPPSTQPAAAAAATTPVGGQSVTNSVTTSSSSSSSSRTMTTTSSNSAATTATHSRVDRTQTTVQRRDHQRQITAGKERNNNKERDGGAPAPAPTNNGQADNNGLCAAAGSSSSNHVSIACDDVTKSDCNSVVGDGDPTLRPDPYEFSCKQEDSVFGRPTKKIKLEKQQQLECGVVPVGSRQLPETRDVSVDACHVGVVTDPDCLGPCEPGTTVTLEGIVWNETENGLLVVNVTWRGKTYVGTLMDATKHHWAPPRFASESPTSDLDGRTPKGRGKRGRTCTAASVRDISDRKLRSNRCSTSGTGKSSSSSSTAAAGCSSPVRCDSGQQQASIPKKRGAADSQSQQANGSNFDSCRTAAKSNRSESRMSITLDGSDSSGNDGVLIECPAPNCSKKFRHINGLRYHQSRAHPNSLSTSNEGDDVDDAEGCRHKLAASKSKTDGDILAELESTSDGEKNELMAEEIRLTDKSDRKNKGDKSKSKHCNVTVVKSADVLDVPGSPAGCRPANDDALSAATEKHKHRKKDRNDRPKDQSRYSEVVGVDAYRSLKDSVSTDATPISELDDVNSDVNASLKADETATWPAAGSSTHTLTTSETTIQESTIYSDVVTGDAGTAPEPSGLVPPLKRPKTTPTKYGNDVENPHSPAYSDISDANDSAPMLEKEMSGTVADDDELTVNSGLVIERCPVTQTSMDTYTPAFTSSGQSSVYGQPPCLTPAVGPVSSNSVNTAGGIGEKPGDIGINQNDDRSGTMFGGPKPKLSGDAGRITGPESSGDVIDRNLGPSPQLLTRPHVADIPHARLQPSPSQVLPPTFLMQYPHFIPTSSSYPTIDQVLLLQNPEYRAQYERFLQQQQAAQAAIARPPSSPSLIRPPVSGDLLPGFPIAKQGEVDRRGKADTTHHAGTLPTPPSLIPDRGAGPFEENDGRGLKPKLLDRKDDQQQQQQRSYANQQQYGTSDRQRSRYDDQTAAAAAATNKESSSGKPSAVVAPQTRDRMMSSTGSSKIPRTEDLPRNSLPSSHDQNRPPSHNKQPSKSIPSSHQDSVPRQSKELDRGSRDEKSMVNVARNSSAGTPFKKDDPGMLQSPVANMPLPIAGAYPPYYPYLPGQFDPAAFYTGLAASPVMSFAGAAPGPFLHPAGAVGYLPQLAASDGPAGGPHLSPSDGKLPPRDGPQRGFYPVDNSGLPPGGAPHKIHELKNVAKGISGDSGAPPVTSTGGPNITAVRDMMQPESRGGMNSVVGHQKDVDRTTASPPTQRHVHTHHHTHMLGPPLFGGVFAGVTAPMMSTSQAGAPSNPLPRQYIGK